MAVVVVLLMVPQAVAAPLEALKSMFHVQEARPMPDGEQL